MRPARGHALGAAQVVVDPAREAVEVDLAEKRMMSPAASALALQAVAPPRRRR